MALEFLDIENIKLVSIGMSLLLQFCFFSQHFTFKYGLGYDIYNVCLEFVAQSMIRLLNAQ